MDLSFQVDGLENLKRTSGVLANTLRKEVLIALDASGRHVMNEAKRSIMQGTKSGRLYTRRSVTHRASAPGQPPASDTGRLANSINKYLVPNALEAIVVAGRGLVKYARMLEFGTINMAARPFFFPAAEKSRAWIRARLNESVARAIKKSGKK